MIISTSELDQKGGKDHTPYTGNFCLPVYPFISNQATPSTSSISRGRASLKSAPDTHPAEAEAHESQTDSWWRKLRTHHDGRLRGHTLKSSPAHMGANAGSACPPRPHANRNQLQEAQRYAHASPSCHTHRVSWSFRH